MKINDGGAMVTTPQSPVRRNHRTVFNSRLWLLIAAGLLGLSGAVQAQYIYTTNNGAITITGFTGGGGALAITNTINNLPVTGIGPSAFRGTSLTSIVVPSSVTNIGTFAFLRCASLTEILVDTNNPAYSSAEGVLFDKNQQALIQCPGGKVGSYTIPNSVISIYGEAFDSCIGLTNVTLGASVVNVPVAASLAFYNCTALSTITVNPSNTTYRSVDGVLFNKNQTTLVLYPLGKPGGYTIPAGVTNLGYFAFYLCANLTGITIPSSVTQIDIGALSHCQNLTNVTIPSSVTSLGDAAFRSCSSLTNITISSSVTSIGDYAFANCSSLPSVAIPQGVISLGSGVFSSCNSLTNLTIPASVTSIGTQAFYDDSHLAAIIVDPSNTNYSSLDGVLFDRNQTKLIQCPGGKTGNYSIPPGVTNLADSAFYNCRQLTRITIPSGVTQLGTYEFYSCTSLTNVTIPSSVTVIGTYAFAEDYNLLSITIPTSVTRLEYGAFYDCSSLASVTLPNNVTSLGDSAFYSCANLTNVILGSGVTNLGPNAFAYCNSLSGVYCQGNAPSNGAGLFSGATNATVYYLPGAIGFDATYAGRPTALWSAAPYVMINVTANPANGGTGTGSGTYPIGTNVLIAATASNGWRFTSWSDSSQDNPHTITVPTTNATYTAGFTSCNYAWAVASTNVAAIASGGSVNLTAETGCAWSATSTTNWIHTTSSGSGNGMVSYTFDANPTGVARAGTITINGQTFTVNQAGAPCTYAFSTASTNVAANAGAGSVRLTTLSGCNWTAVSATNWIHTTSSGTGNGTASYTFDANPAGTARLGTITINGEQTFTVNQLGATASIVVQASPANGGTVTGTGTYPVGTNVQITAVAHTAWHFVGWNDSNTNATRSIAVPLGGATYTASFTSLFTGAAPAILTPPVITNALLVISNQFVIVVGETNVFNVSAADPVDDNLLRYRWNFGDGQTSAWSAVAVATHVYATNGCGPYTASVTVSNTQAAISSNLNVSAACQLTITKLLLGVSFIKTNADSGTLSATLPLPGRTNLTQLTGATILVDIGNAQIPFTLDSKGRSGSPVGMCRLVYKKPTKTKPGYWTATIALSKGTWRATWAAFGLDNATHKNPGVRVTVPVVVLVGTEAFAAEPALHYSATLNKTGTAK